MHILDAQQRISNFTGPGAVNDADMLEVGVDGTMGNKVCELYVSKNSNCATFSQVYLKPT